MDPKILILGLHHVGLPERGTAIRGLFTSPLLLRYTIRLLKILGYQFSTLKDAFSSTEPRIAVLTFDDGYSDVYNSGVSILHRFAIPATFFVVTADVGKSGIVWDEASEKVPADLLNWQTLGELKLKGWEIASHCDEHVHLDRRSLEEQSDLVEASVARIERELGEIPLSFAFPYGAFESATKEVLRRSGIRYAVTTRAPRGVDSSAYDLLELPRVAIGGRKMSHFVKVTIRIGGAVGYAEFLSSLLAAPLRLAQGFVLGSSASRDGRQKSM